MTGVILLGIIYILNNEYEKEVKVKEGKIADEKEKVLRTAPPLGEVIRADIQGSQVGMHKERM